MKILRALAFAAAFVVCAPAYAQWQTDTHSVPIGKGPGYTGFNKAAPGALGQTLNSGGPTADPSFKPSAVRITPQIYGATCDGAVDDTTPVTNAVANALSTSGTVYLDGTCLTTASIPNMHAVKWAGSGSIKRGSNVFTPNPASTNTNTLFVSTFGNDANDGLSSLQPMQTIQTAVNAWTNYGATLQGMWVIQGAAGTYPRGFYFPANLTAGVDSFTDLGGIFGRLVIKGPDVGGSPNVPTMIISGASSPGTNYGALFNGHNRVLLQDIKFDGWNATPDTTYGVNFTDFSNIYAKNVHHTNFGVAVIGRASRYYQDGGLIDTGVSGIILLNGSDGSIGNAVLGAGGHPASIKNCTVLGLNVAEQSGGHFLGLVDNCAIGVYVLEQSHVQIDSGSTIRNNVTAGIQVAAASSYFDGGITFSNNGSGQVNVASTSYSVADANTQYAYQTSSRSYLSFPETFTVGTGETTLVSNFLTIPAGRMLNSNNVIHFKATGSFVSNQGTRTISLKIGSAVVAQTTLAGNSTNANSIWNWEGDIFGNGTAAQLYYSTLVATVTPYVNVTGSNSTVTMTGATQLSITGQCANGADTINLNRLEIWQTF